MKSDTNNKRNNRNEILYQLLTGMGAVVVLFLGELFSTIGYTSAVYWGGHLILVTLFYVLFFLFARVRKFDGQVKVVIHVFAIVVCVYSVLCMCSDFAELGFLSVAAKILNVIGILCMECFLIHGEKKNGRCSSMKEVFKRGVLEYLPVLGIIAVSVLLSINSQMLQFRWDGALYYEAAQDASLYSYSHLALYGHQSQAAAAFMRFGIALAGGNAAIGMFVANMLVYVIGILYFWKIVNFVFKQHSKVLHFVLTLLFAFSPFLLGMSNYYSVDFYLICLYPVVLYYTFRKQWVLQVVSGILFCFTKEPAVIIYACTGIAILLYDAVCLKRTMPFHQVLGVLIRMPKYYGMLLVGGLWIVSIKLLGAWAGGNSSIELDFRYMIEKLKVLYALNFSWLLLVLILVLLIAGRLKKVPSNFRYEKLVVLLPLLGFTAFSIVFKTVNHARYVDIAPIALMVLLLIVICNYMDACGKRKTGQIAGMGIGAVLTVLFLVQSFVTIDPVSGILFINVSTGNGTMITTADEFPGLGDSMIYNKQMLWMGEAIDLAVSDGIEEQTEIVFPMDAGNPYSFDGASGVEMMQEDSYTLTMEYWNPNLKMREVTDADHNDALTVINAENIEGLQNACEKGRKYSYVYIDVYGSKLADQIRKTYTVLTETEYDNKNWKVYRICFEG